MYALNLPPYNPKISINNGKKTVYDSQRRKNVALTPEEWVRQHFVNYLITEKRYPAERIANEVSINLNGTSKRCDTVVYNDYLEPLVIIEYKSPQVKIDEEVFAQIIRYNFKLTVPYLIVSNGINHYCCNLDYEKMESRFLKYIPFYNEINI
jgi:type I site-specific restriction endonuclease